MRSNRTIARSLVCALLVLPLARVSVADVEAQAWLENIWQRAAHPEKSGGMTLRWEEADEYVPRQEHLIELRAAVQGHPEHPGLATLRKYEAILAGKPPMVVHGLWIHGDKWRVNWDFSVPSHSYFDRALTAKTAWGLGPSNLTRLDPQRGLPVGYEYATETGSFQRESQMFLTGGLSLSPLGDTPCPEIVLHEKTWRVQAQLARGLLEANGQWHADDRTGTVEYVRFSNKFNQQMTYTSDGWKPAAPNGPWTCSVLVTQENNPPARTKRTLLEAAQLDEATLDLVTTMPPTNGNDAIRGRMTFHSVQDFTGSVPKDVDVVRPEQGSAHEDTARTLRGYESIERIRLLGWIAAGCIVTLLVAIRVRRASLLSARGRP